MDSIAHRVALVAASALIATMAFAAGPASAVFPPTYCDVTMSSGTWCGNGENHAFNSNQSSTPVTSPQAWVCERLLYADTTSVVPNPSCAYSLTSQTYSGFFQTEAEANHNTAPSRIVRGNATV